MGGPFPELPLDDEWESMLDTLDTAFKPEEEITREYDATTWQKVAQGLLRDE